MADLPPGKTRYPLHRRLSGPQGLSRLIRNISPPSEFDPWTVQPVASTIPTTLSRHIKLHSRSLNGRHQLERPSRVWEMDVIMHLTVTGCKDVDWIQMARRVVQCCAVKDTVMAAGFRLKTRYCLNND
jgi:hypothetical protein